MESCSVLFESLSPRGQGGGHQGSLAHWENVATGESSSQPVPRGKAGIKKSGPGKSEPPRGTTQKVTNPFRGVASPGFGRFIT